MRKLTIAASLLLVSFMAMAQIMMPPASPTFEVKGTVGLATVKVVYSRPSAKGRVVAGNLIPYNEVWRTGANSPTLISFSEAVKLNGNAVPAGEYALYTQFTEKVATIILSKNTKLWGAMGYQQSDDLLRFDVEVKHPSSMYETFTISFSDFTMNSANLNLKWEHTKAMFTIESDVDAKVMADIKAQVIDATPSNAGVYFQAATYYFDTDRDSKLALTWVDKAIAGGQGSEYWVYHLKAKLQAKLGDKKGATETAKLSMDLAQKGGNPDYVRLNEKLIASMK
ncbi:MAG: hypothetical protein COW03_06950 [Cytophagales bacterium CG12_big_fil_rev_8_21_14_0_65_40_12]|nr:MAG: hypothetical protein COW03_06950 [Cytophagales bacterium CG12_big_fil_rev_8_21_14_0_65_40_12]PIW02852.1 MAG: hypothetical protein COW40_17870 [Cytophagales bacterium CG17_big_fil_post_rev_8_21_14_2_50_40_13]